MFLSRLVKREVKTSWVHGDKTDYLMTELNLTVGGQTFLLLVVLAPRLFHAPCHPGLDVPTQLDFVHSVKAKSHDLANGHQFVESPNQEVKSFGE